MIEIIPALIPQNLNIVREEFGKVLGSAKKVQIDIIDGEYAPVKTWPFNREQPDEMLAIARGQVEFPYINDFLVEVDMLLLHPIEYLPDLISMGAKSFVIHLDSTDHLKECLETIKNCLGCEAGIGVKPSSDMDLLETFISDADFIQFMGNEKVGYNGVELDKTVLEKIKVFHDRYRSIPIQIDIGVSESTIPGLKAAGVSRFISNSAIFNSKNPREALARLSSL